MTSMKIIISGQNLIIKSGRICFNPANDSRTLIRGPLSELHKKERDVLQNLACDDIDEKSAWKELALIRKSILAHKGQGVLKVA